MLFVQSDDSKQPDQAGENSRDTQPRYNRYKKGEHINGFLLRDVACFIGPRQDSYTQSFYLVQSGHFCMSFVGLFLGGIWAAARKMWMFAALLFVILFAFSVINPLVAFLMECMVGGLYGMRMYSRHIVQNLVKLAVHGRQDLDDPMIDCRLEQAGGLSYPALACAVLLKLIWFSIFIAPAIMISLK